MLELRTRKALLGGVEVPDPDELLAGIAALETWRAQTDKRNVETAKKRKAGPTATAAPAAVATSGSMEHN